MKRLVEFFRQRLQSLENGGVGETASDHSLQLATAVLLVETARADYEFDEAERDGLIELLGAEFELDAGETEALLELAHQRAEDAVSLFRYTRSLTESLTMERREQLVERMWDVALADGRIDKYEDHFIRKTADLLYVSHAAFVRGRHRAEQRRLSKRQ